MYRTPVARNFDIKTRVPRKEFVDNRFRIAKGVLLAGAGLIIVRLFMLQVLDASFYRTLASEQRETYRELFPERGEILMHEGDSGGFSPLATNKDVYLVYADPRLVLNPEKTAKMIAPLLGIEKGANYESVANSRISNSEIRKLGSDSQLAPIDKYQELLDHLSKKNDPYEPLKRGVEEAAVNEIKKLAIAGIDAVREPIRYYPLKNIGSQLAGFLGSDGEHIAGRYGIEEAFDAELGGTPGFFKGEHDVAGRWIPVGSWTLVPAVDGGTVVLTIDRAIEYYACSHLNEAVAKHKAESGAVVIMDIKTGAILAMCGAPDFDPNDYGKVKDIGVYKNPAVSYQYEPGSVFKVITMAAGLETGEITPETTYEDTGQVQIGKFSINNSDHKAHGVQTMTGVLEKSLNTGAMFVARKVGIDRFRDFVQRFGFGAQAGIELKGEARGDVDALSKRGDIYLATASFGQGISVTPLQMAAAIGAIGNQGNLMKPYLIDEIRKANGARITTSPTMVREVISKRAATLLSGMMVSVVERGHGRRAGVPGYYVAGKTGTAQIPRSSGGGYESDATIGTFVGFAPMEDPKFVMLVRIDRPKDVQFAESSAAPLFGEIAKFLLQYYEIKPTRAISVK